MKYLLLTFLVLFSFGQGKAIAQDTTKTPQLANQFLASVSDSACHCIDSIDSYDKSSSELLAEIDSCIGKQVSAFQLYSKILKNSTDTADTVININLNKESIEYRKYYYEIQRYLMDSCSSLKLLIASRDKQDSNSVSQNPQARALYTQGVRASENQDYKTAVVLYKKAIAIDSNFAFAWDNLGLSYRKLGAYDKAIDAYKHSISIDSTSVTPLQNLAVAYRFEKKYQEAIAAYKKLAELDENNSEVYYGIGQVYIALNDYEKALQNFCKAYNLYTKLQSPYRVDAGKMISIVYELMKEKGQLDKFNKILKSYNITLTN